MISRLDARLKHCNNAFYAFACMRIPLPAQSELSSWKAIASYLGVSVKTAQLWETQRGLPVRRYPGDRRVQVRALVFEVEAWKAGAAQTSAAAAVPVVLPPQGRPWPPWQVALLAVVLTGATAAGVVAITSVRHAERRLIAERILPVTTSPDLEVHPAIRSSGDRLAFVQIAVDEKPWLAIRDLLTGRTEKVDRVLQSTMPRWSPNGEELAYAVPHENGVSIRVRGQRGALRDVTFLAGLDRQTEALNALSLEWLSESVLVVSDRDDRGVLRLTGVRVSDGSRQDLTSPPARIAGDVQPAASGDLLAFVRYRSLSEGDVYVRDLKSGTERRLTNDNARIDGMAWLAGRTGLVIASNRGEHGVSLYHLPIHGGLARLSGSEGSAQFPSIAGRTLVFQSTVRDTNIWEQGSGLARTIAASTTPEHSPSISPDGKRIAFISKRTGATEVWIADSEDKTVQLTNLGQTYTDSPRWSPDGRTIAFTSHQDGNRDIFLVDVPTRRTKRFTAEPSEEGRPSWSPDGGALYFRSDRSGSQQIWRQPINGGATQVTQHGGFEPFASLTANLIYYIKQRDKPELWSVAPQGGVETQEAAGVMESRWAVGFGGVYFMRLSVPGGVFHWDPLTRQERTVLTLAKHGRIEGGFSANREGTKFAWTQTDSHTADILKATLTLQ